MRVGYTGYVYTVLMKGHLTLTFAAKAIQLLFQVVWSLPPRKKKKRVGFRRGQAEYRKEDFMHPYVFIV